MLMPLRLTISNRTCIAKCLTQDNQETQFHIQDTKSLSNLIFPVKDMDTSKTFTSNQNTHNKPGLFLNKLDFKDF